MNKVIAKYKCNNCNKYYSSYQSLWIHKKKFHNTQLNIINPHSSSIHPHSSSILPHSSSINKVDNNKLECNLCKKILSRSDNLSRHIKICIKKNNLENSILNNNINSNIQNNSNNIIINNPGSENILDLTEKEIKKIFNNSDNSLIKMIEYLNFNNRLPENHSFCSTNLESNYLSVYDSKTKKIKKDKKNNIFSNLLYSLTNKLLVLYNNNKFKLDDKNLDNISNVLDNILKVSLPMALKSTKKEILKDINILSYNNKDVIHKTWITNNIDPEELLINNSDSDSDTYSDNEEKIIDNQLKNRILKIL